MKVSRNSVFRIIEKNDKESIYEKSVEKKISAYYDFFMIGAIILSLVPLAFKSEPKIFLIIDWVTAIIFCVDYILRWITADYKYEDRYKETPVLSFIRYPFSFMAIMDLLSIIPTFLSMFPAFKVLKIFRLLRAMRVIRVFKATRYSKNLEIIAGVIDRSKGALIAVGTLAIGYVLVAALLVFNVEMDSFGNFFEAVYWATVSLTTVGYGDIYPITTAGRIVTMISSIVGIAVVALPAGIITAGYMKEIEKKQ